MLKHALQPRWIASLVLVLLLVTLFVGLSAWQVSRAQHKNDVVASADLNEVKPFNDVLAAQVPMGNEKSDQLVAVSGHFLDMQVAVKDRVYDGQKGYWVVTMFEVDGAHMGEAAGLADAPRKPIAVPVIRGWAATEDQALHAAIPYKDMSIVARIGPTEGPVPQVGERTVMSVSTAQLVNFFDVYSYGGILFPDQDSWAQVAPELKYVGLTPAQDGGLDLQSAFYAVEWLVFAGFALYIWFQMLRDSYDKHRSEQSGQQEFVVVKEPGEHL